MNEVSYDAPRPEAARDLADAMLVQQAAGPAATEELARTFLARVQRDIDEQVDLRVKEQLTGRKVAQGISSQEKELILGSLGIGVPLTAIAAFSSAGFWGVAVVWVGLVIINVAWTRRR